MIGSSGPPLKKLRQSLLCFQSFAHKTSCQTFAGKLIIMIIVIAIMMMMNTSHILLTLSHKDICWCLHCRHTQSSPFRFKMAPYYRHHSVKMFTKGKQVWLDYLDMDAVLMWCISTIYCGKDDRPENISLVEHVLTSLALYAKQLDVVLMWCISTIYCGKDDRPENISLVEHVLTSLASCMPNIWMSCSCDL